jgi:hypothetical protein
VKYLVFFYDNENLDYTLLHQGYTYRHPSD